MPDDYKNLTAGELEQTASNSLLTLVYLLVESGVERTSIRPDIDKINTAIAELTFRADNYSERSREPEINRLKGALMATRLQLHDAARGIDAVLADRGGEENDDQ